MRMKQILRWINRNAVVKTAGSFVTRLVLLCGVLVVRLRVARPRASAAAILTTAFLVLGFLTSCHSSDKTSLSRGRKALEKSDYDSAIREFTKVTEQSTDPSLISESSRFLADIYIAQKKDYKMGLKYLDVSINTSANALSSRESMKRKAAVLFHHLSRYDEAIPLYVRLLGSDQLSPAETGEYRLNLAKSYFLLSQFQQARIEAQRVLKDSEDPQHRDRASKLIADTYISGDGDGKDAAEQYKKIMGDIQDVETKKDMALNLALWLEQKEKYKEAFTVLENLNLKEDEFIAAKMKQLDRLYLLQTRRPK